MRITSREDIAKAVKLGSEFWGDSHPGVPFSPEGTLDFWSGDDCARVFATFQGDRIVALVAALLGHSPTAGGKQALIVHWVAKQGGVALLREAIQALTSEGAESITLTLPKPLSDKSAARLGLRVAFTGYKVIL